MWGGLSYSGLPATFLTNDRRHPGLLKWQTLAHSFGSEQMVELVRAGLATATAERIVMGPRTIEVTRVRITDAGHKDGRGEGMSRNARGRLMAACLLACAVVVIGLAVAGALQQIRAIRTPVAIVAK
jgi:hypothetical protein